MFVQFFMYRKEDLDEVEDLEQEDGLDEGRGRSPVER